MQISEKDFLNYIRCPLYYKLESNGYDLEKDSYNKFLEKSEGKDPDFPLMTFSDKANSSGGIFKAEKELSYSF